MIAIMTMTIIAVAIILRRANISLTVVTVTAMIVMAGEIRTTIEIKDGGVVTVTPTIAAPAIGEITAAMADAIRRFTKMIRNGIATTATPTTFTTVAGFLTAVEFTTVATILMVSRATRKALL